MEGVRILTAGEQGLVVEFGNVIDPNINRRVHQLSSRLLHEKKSEILEVVPTYRSLLIYFDPLRLSRQQLIGHISVLLNEKVQETTRTDARVISIPVCYGGEYGPDLPFVAEHNNLTEDEVVKIHTSIPYLVYMIGFTPGFPYLGGMSARIATPRLEKPRTRIPAGSVGIAGSQTGFYPVESPGGWQLIGRTPIQAFNPKADNPFLFAAGDYLQFQPILNKEYDEIRQAVEAGSYTPVVSALPQEGGAAQ